MALHIVKLLGQMFGKMYSPLLVFAVIYLLGVFTAYMAEDSIFFRILVIAMRIFFVLLKYPIQTLTNHFNKVKVCFKTFWCFAI